MVHQIVSVILRTKSLRHVSFKETRDYVLQLVRHWNSMSFRVREDNVALPNQVAQFVVVLVHKRRSASHHLINQDA